MKSCVYNCPITGYKIECLVDTKYNYAVLNIFSDFEYMRALGSLVRISVEKLKEEGVKTIHQLIHANEWEYLENKTTWKIIHKDLQNEIYELECHIDDFLGNFGTGIGLD